MILIINYVIIYFDKKIIFYGGYLIMKRKICLILVFILCFSIFMGCNNSNEKWREAFKVIWKVQVYSGGVAKSEYCLTTEENYKKILNDRQYEYNMDWSSKLKKMYVKLNNDICYVKLISWGGMEEIKEHDRTMIWWIDYV